MGNVASDSVLKSPDGADALSPARTLGNPKES
jgi:hypothetical protein